MILTRSIALFRLDMLHQMFCENIVIDINDVIFAYHKMSMKI